MLVLEVTQGLAAGRTFELGGDVVSIGRAPANDLALEDTHVSGEHAKLVVGDGRVVLVDLRSTNGTTRVRGADRLRVTAEDGEVEIETGDVIELGTGDGVTAFRVTLTDDADEAHVVSMRRLDDLAPAAAKVEKDPDRLGALYAAQKRIGAATDLDLVLIEVADAVLTLVPNATHVTIVLRDDDAGDSAGAKAFVPVMTRVRLPSGASGPPGGPVPIARSIYRRVVKERAAVLAADAGADVGGSESIMGASIRSTIGVPLWRGDDIIGVLQADNRSAPSMLHGSDVELLLVLAANASLAVANARLIKRLVSAEERLQKENSFLKGREEKRRGGGREVTIIGKSDAMHRVIAHLDKVVDTRVTVLIEGETGTGKELIAAAVHYRSRRRDKLFVAQNCAALAESLLESELFGHKKGSFTGAVEEKKGLFEIADGGTLFLDEITETPMSLQSKLLRALQEGEIRPVGGTTPKHVNVRIVAATNRNLEDEVQKGRFREDLYYRLKVFPLRLPPLRERREDIPMLAAHFLERYTDEIGKPTGGFTQQAMELMQAYDWPGNVRELQNEVQRLVIQVDPGAFATPELLSPRIRQVEGLVTRAGAAKGTLKETMDSVEKFYLIEALREHGNNKTNAAKSLGITREGLHKKLRAFGISSRGEPMSSSRSRLDLLLPGAAAIDLDGVLRDYAEHGHARVGRVVSDEGLEALRARADDVMMGRVVHEGLFFQKDTTTGSYDDLDFGRGYEGPSLDYRKVEKLERDPIFRAYIENPLFERIARARIEGEIAIYRSVLFNKSKNGGTRLPWHQDAGVFWGLDRDPSLQIWTALDDAPREAGCVEIVPGTHGARATKLGGMVPAAVAEAAGAEARAVPLPARAGELLLIHNYLWHRSGLNTTGAPRRAFTVCYMSAETRCTRKRRAPRSFVRVFENANVNAS